MPPTQHLRPAKGFSSFKDCVNLERNIWLAADEYVRGSLYFQVSLTFSGWRRRYRQRGRAAESPPLLVTQIERKGKHICCVKCPSRRRTGGFVRPPLGCLGPRQPDRHCDGTHYLLIKCTTNEERCQCECVRLTPTDSAIVRQSISDQAGLRTTSTAVVSCPHAAHGTAPRSPACRA